MIMMRGEEKYSAKTYRTHTCPPHSLSSAKASNLDLRSENSANGLKIQHLPTLNNQFFI